MEILKVLELSEQGLTQREIAVYADCSKSTVGEIQQRSREVGLTYDQAKDMDSDALQQLLYPTANTKPFKEHIDWHSIEDRLKRYKKLNLQFIYDEEYIRENPGGLSYSQYCRRFREWREAQSTNLVMIQHHEPGKELFVDWSGDKLQCVLGDDGELAEAHFFVSTLGDSHYPYAEAFADEKINSWLLANIHTLEWIQGIPRVIVPDCLKTGVISPKKYEPYLNPAFKDMADYYGIGIIPARPGKPRDKAIVEGSVGWLETWLIEWLRGKQFFSFAELNEQIRIRLRELARKPFQKRAGSRLSVFEEIDKPALRPLPVKRYEIVTITSCKVPDNYHVPCDEFYYSVPYRFYRQTVTVRGGVKIVEILDSEYKRIATHERRYYGEKYVTNPEHMPPNHRAQHDMRSRNGDSYRQWAGVVGEHTRTFIDLLLKSHPIEETMYRSCMGVLQFEKRHGRNALEEACRQALVTGKISYYEIKRLLQLTAKQKPLPDHENLRDPKTFV